MKNKAKVERYPWPTFSRPCRISGRNPVKWTVLLMVFLVLQLGAQDRPEWQQTLEQKLETSGRKEFLHLVGYFDDKLYVDMFLAHDDDEWVGELLFSGGQMRFDLEGGWVDEQLILLEYDADGQQSGTWKIDKQLEQYVGAWTNPESSMDFNLIMFDELWNPDFQKDWYRQYTSYQGDLGTSSWIVDVGRKQAGLDQIRIFDREQKRLMKTEWTCWNPQCREMLLRVNDPFSPGVVGEYEGTISFNNLKLNKKGFPVPNYDLELISTQNTALRTYLDEQVWLSIEFPVCQDPASRAVIETALNALEDSLKQQLILQADQETEPVSSRWKYFIQSWFEINYWDDQFLSGRWVIQNSWEEGTRAVPINYFMKNDKIIQLKNQFKPGFDLDFFLLHFVQNEVKLLPEYMNPLIRPKLMQADFKHLGFNRNGLTLSTDFDSLFGTFTLEIPFREIEEYIKKRSELSRFLQSLKNG